ncbi:biopolymer transporter ExbD [uncultured Acidaminococcus sp.]|uniref:ExbD/TolR family protein n=1 Tax=uncultured Acidaminococcus sp. TaxID=352152 RepID=UPI0026DAF1EE|nr:biopolymer transporter ExbD [uncultured Acidaminococcus sp.]
MIKLKDRKKNNLGIMISPMIDMSFLLLVFFIVTTMNMSEVETVPVQLPAATQTRIQPEARFNVAVKADGSLYLGTKPVTREALIAQAKAAAAKDPQFSLVIYGDGQVPYEKILGLLDDCKAAGILRVGLAAEKAADHGQQ